MLPCLLWAVTLTWLGPLLSVLTQWACSAGVASCSAGETDMPVAAVWEFTASLVPAPTNSYSWGGTAGWRQVMRGGRAG